MITIQDSLAGEPIEFHFVEDIHDARKALAFARANPLCGLDTESTGVNCYKRGWRLRTFQIGNSNTSFILPAQAKRTIGRILNLNIKWIGHNLPHDIRSIDKHLGYETGITGAETYIPGHHKDPRNQREGGLAHGLKEQCEALIDPMAGKWERALKVAFKEILIPIPGEVYKSGPRKGTQKYRKAKISEGYSLIDLKHPAYIAYAGSDSILAFHLWNYYKPTVRQFLDLYRFDHKVQLACDRLQRRAILLDVKYTERLHAALDKSSKKFAAKAAELGCANIYSTDQLAKALIELGAILKEYTPKGRLKVDDKVLQEQLKNGNEDVRQLVRYVLAAKRRAKRREAYTGTMLRERDDNNRIHPAINSLAARTARMSVSEPALQQLPTRESES